MIALDLLGAAVAWMFVLAVTVYRSVTLIYIAAFLQEVLGGLYEPSRSAILPLMTNNNEEQMKKATILCGMAWSAVAAFGSAAGGFLVAMIGIKECFVVDSLTYVVSAIFMMFVGEGNWNVAKSQHEGENGERRAEPLRFMVKNMLMELTEYLTTASFTPIILFKFSVLWLTLDVVNVSLSERDGVDESTAAFRLGLLFGSVGIGCFIGPLVAEEYTSMEEPKTLQAACVVSVWIAAIGCLCMGFPHLPFWLLCLLTGLRSTGVSALWINSSLILQKFCTPDMLGRVSSIDLALALMAESATATVAGLLEDKAGLSPEQVCLSVGLWGIIMSVAWTIFHRQGGGVALKPAKSFFSEEGDHKVESKGDEIELAAA